LDYPSSLFLLFFLLRLFALLVLFAPNPQVMSQVLYNSHGVIQISCFSRT
jgi:hypothetical protein